MKIMRALLAWTAEEGSRAIVHATSLGRESLGVYISLCRLEKYVRSFSASWWGGVKAEWW